MNLTDNSFTKFLLDNPDSWFNPQKKYDKFISDEFNYLLNYDLLKKNIPAISIENKDILFNFILICDQLPYYIYRYSSINRAKYNLLVLPIVESLIDTTVFDEYNDIEKCFILLPLRHSYILRLVQKSLDKIVKLRNENDTAIYRRFHKATLIKIGKLINMSNIKSVYSDTPINQKILDVSSTYDRTNNYNIMNIDNEKIIDTFEKFIPTILSNSFCISISGGVDSMVATWIMSKFIKSKYITAVHINYGNRPSSDDEMNLCIRWCNMLEIPIYTRKINEIKRSRDKDREMYEEVTRLIRFGMYKLINQPIILGHNKDDKVENIFSNIIKEKKLDNLFGMEYISREDEVNILRPMLDISKNEIYKFAQKYKIPYVYDSTPSWSERGMKRDKLIPFLNNFDPRIINGLIEMSQHITSMNRVYQDKISEMVIFSYDKDRLYKDKGQQICNIKKQIMEYDIYVWFDIFSYICKCLHLPYISKKSIENLYNQINPDSNKKITLSSTLFFYNFNVFIVS